LKAGMQAGLAYNSAPSMMLLANSGKALQRSPNGQEFGSRARFQAGGPAASDMTAEFANSILLWRHPGEVNRDLSQRHQDLFRDETRKPDERLERSTGHGRKCCRAPKQKGRPEGRPFNCQTTIRSGPRCDAVLCADLAEGGDPGHCTRRPRLGTIRHKITSFLLFQTVIVM
jgi:hypothetical protein